MKIGVVTFWNGNDNYGMLFQCWALQKYLKKTGHQPFVIKFDAKGNIIKRVLREILFLVRVLFCKKDREQLKLRRLNNEKNKKRDFDSFRVNNIQFSERTYYYIEKLRKKPPFADCYISGSDQIWRGSLRFKNIWGYFLDFGPNNIRRVAYAPSFGMKDYPASEENLLAKALHRYDFVSCRENDGVEICKKVGVKSIKVEDPTLLLDAKDYLEICAKPLASSYVFIYSINISAPEDIFYNDIKSVINEKEIIVTPSKGYLPSRELFGSEVNYIYPNPHEWLSLIAYSDLVVTTSFHGVVFSIIFNKKFVYVPLKGMFENSNNRVLDLLHSLELDCTIVNDSNDIGRSIGIDINWDAVNKRKDRLVEESKTFLVSALR